MHNRSTIRPRMTTAAFGGPVAAVLVATLALAGCSVGSDSADGGGSSGAGSSSGGAGASGSGANGSGSGGATGGGKTVTLVTHDSWVMDKTLTAQFEKQTGYKLKVVQQGDAGKLANSVVLAKGAPVGDVVFGIDNTFASRVVDAGALQDYSPSALPASASAYKLDGASANQLTPIDYGDVCVNVDDAWFASHKKAKPNSLDDLVKPQYKGLFVTPGAATSSPGMAFLLTTIAKYGENGWQGYWKKLMSNDTKVTSGWSDAWGVDYTAGGGNGDRPIVLSYNTSPADTMKAGKPTTSALMDTCFQQVEYAGVLKGASNAAGAKAFVDFMLGKPFQTALPGTMYVLPVDSSVALPSDWKVAVKTPDKPFTIEPATIAKNRDSWLQSWQDIAAK